MSKSKADEEFVRNRQMFMAAEKAAEKLDKPLWFTVGTSLAFEAAVLLLAFWRFSTREF